MLLQVCKKIVTETQLFVFSGAVSSRSPGPSHFQPIKQPNSNPNSPQPFHPRSYQSTAPAVQRTTVTSIKQPILHPPSQTVNLQEYVNQFSRELITHTLAWPADTVEKQVQPLLKTAKVNETWVVLPGWLRLLTGQ
jgi:hypothetical protein